MPRKKLALGDVLPFLISSKFFLCPPKHSEMRCKIHNGKSDWDWGNLAKFHFHLQKSLFYCSPMVASALVAALLSSRSNHQSLWGLTSFSDVLRCSLAFEGTRDLHVLQVIIALLLGFSVYLFTVQIKKLKLWKLAGNSGTSFVTEHYTENIPAVHPSGLADPWVEEKLLK